MKFFFVPPLCNFSSSIRIPKMNSLTHFLDPSAHFLWCTLLSVVVLEKMLTRMSEYTVKQKWKILVSVLLFSLLLVAITAVVTYFSISCPSKWNLSTLVFIFFFLLLIYQEQDMVGFICLTNLQMKEFEHWNISSII